MRSTRDWFGDELVAAARAHGEVVVVNADLATATRTAAFRDAHPDRFFNAGIAEANAIGIAAGLAMEGLRPFVTSFGHFLAGKWLEIFQSVGLNNSGVVLVGTHAGLAIGQDGPSQMGLRDLALMRTLPNVEILQPADGAETGRMMSYLLGHARPVYLRLCRQPLPEVTGAATEFTFGRPTVLASGQDIVIFAMGGTVAVVMEAIPGLARYGVHPTVVNVSSLPVAADAVTRLLSGHAAACVIEDHATVGGLADEIGRIILGYGQSIRYGALGVGDYGQTGTPADLYRRYGLDVAGITAAVGAFAGGAAMPAPPPSS